MPTLDRVSKAVAAISILLIVGLQIALHPDQTWLLRALATLALLLGWLSGRLPGQSSHTFWLLMAPLAPALLLGLAGREGPVVELVWMAGLTGALLRTMSWSSWDVPQGWKPLAAGWALTISLAWPVIVAREAGFSLSGLADNGAIVTEAQLSSPQAIGWALHAALTQLLGLLWLDWLAGFLARRPDRIPPVVHGLWVGATLASFVAIYQGAIDLSFLNTANWNELRRAPGTLLDANAYGMCAALAGPLAYIALPRGRLRYASVLAPAVLVVNLVGMWMSGSRTALLCALFGMMAIALASWSASRAFVRRLVPIGAAVVALGLALIVLAGHAVGPVARLLDTPEGGHGPFAELWHRGGYGDAALEMIREHPLTGVGLGAFHVLVADFHVAPGQTLPFDNAQNWWRHQAAELGLLGGAVVLAWSAVIAWRVLTGHARPTQRPTAITVRGLLVGLGACSMLGVPTQSPLVLLWFMLLVAWLTVLLEDVDVPALRRHATLASRVVGTMAVAYAVLHLASGAFGSLSVTSRAIRAHRPFVSGAYPIEELPAQDPFQWTAREDARFLWPVAGPWLVVRTWAQHPDIETNPVQVTLETDCGTIVSEQLSTTDAVTRSVRIPLGLQAVNARLHVSRTWRPSDYGGDDRRRLGAGIQASFLERADLATGEGPAIDLPTCTP